VVSGTLLAKGNVLENMELQLVLIISMALVTGSHMECISKLHSFGIQTNMYPLTEDNEVTNEAWTQFLEKRRKQERRMQKGVERIGVPGRFDVLFGRGKAYQQHIGNVRYRSLIEECKAQYDRASREEKTQITEEIVQIVKQSTGRFLKDDGAGWEEVEDVVARLKASHTFRGMRAGANKTSASSRDKRQDLPSDMESGDTASSSKRMRN
jgi:hypothetical protein